MTIVRTIRRASLILLVAAVAACNTVQGAGQDIESLGKAGERAID
ncbi:MAG: entericidin A/B family lipoprotein [Alphaproteobacteria bacterium]